MAFDLKECISFILGVIKRYLVSDSVFLLSEEFDPFFFSPLQKYLGVRLWIFLNRGWVYLVLDFLRRARVQFSLFSLFVFILYFDGFHES